MRKSIKRAVSGVMAGMLCASAFGTNALAEFKGDFDVQEISSGYAIAVIRSGAVREGTVVIPDEIDGTLVTQLGAKNGSSTFLGQNGVTKLVIGKNIRSATTTAFYEAGDLREIEIDPDNKGSLAFDKESGVLSATSGGNGILVKYLSTNEKKNYQVPDGTIRIFNMDHAEFDTLDLNQVTSVEHITFAGTRMDILIIGNATVRESPDILYGALVGRFDASGSSRYDSDRKSLWSEGRLIKIANGAEFSEGYFDRFDSVSPYAFNSIAEYRSIEALLPESLIRDVVFSFYNQDAAVFMVNGEISFCYNYNLGVPTKVGNSTDYSEDIDAEKYEKIKALMYAGVPYDGTGLFQQVFGVDYDEIASDIKAAEHGDAALNAVSAVLYETLDGVTPNQLRGVGYGVFTEEKVKEYMSCLREAVKNHEQYHFTPRFSASDGSISFHRAGNGYESDEFVIDIIDGNGMVNPSYIYTLHLTTPGMAVKETGETSFKTGRKVILVSETEPSEISIDYDEPSLKYYMRTSDGVQDVLCSAVKRMHGELAVTVTAGDILISKQDVTTGKELSGATLILTKDGVEVEQWISGEVPHTIKNPEDGIYHLTERTAPDGYDLAETITFEVKDGTVPDGKIIMYDQPISKEIQISKQDMATGRELPGAELTLSKDGTVVEQWISGNMPHVITGLEDGTYVLTEITAPMGYEIAESITFDVVDGRVAGGGIVMKDKQKMATPSNATPSVATPSNPNKPEEPDNPTQTNKPDHPDVDEKPSVPVTQPSGGSGNRGSRITGSSTSGPGVVKPEGVQPEEPNPVETIPPEISLPEEYDVLPKTGDRTAAPVIALISFLMLFMIMVKKRIGVKR